MADDFAYDVFLSHSSKDKPVVRAVAERLRADHPEATELSAGMSGDLEAAVAAGATFVRVGTAIFGERPLPSGEDRGIRTTRVTPAPRATDDPGV